MPKIGGGGGGGVKACGLRPKKVTHPKIVNDALNDANKKKSKSTYYNITRNSKVL